MRNYAYFIGSCANVNLHCLPHSSYHAIFDLPRQRSGTHEAEQKQVKSRSAELQAELAKAQEATVNAEKFMKVVRKYTSFEKLTHTLLRELIEKIVVHECSYDENGTRRQDIDIYYSFVGKVELPDE